MFERFTQEARLAVRSAADVAWELQHHRVTTAHLLFGLAVHGEAVGRSLERLGLGEATLRARLRTQVVWLGGRELDTEALAAIGVDYEAVREAAERRFGAGALGARAVCQAPRRSWWRRKSRSVRFSGEARRALERTLRIALARGDKELHPYHLLLAMLADPRCAAVRLIERDGLSIADVRTATGLAG